MVTDIFTQPVLKVAYKIKTESKGSRLVKLSYEFYHVVSFIQGSTMDQQGMTLSYEQKLPQSLTTISSLRVFGHNKIRKNSITFALQN